MMPRWPTALLCSVVLALPPLLHAQTPDRVYGAPYHDPGRAFIDLMIPHHEMAVMMSQHAVTMARTDGVRQIAQKMLDEQTGEIRELKALRRSLFGSDSTRSHSMQGMMQMMGMHQMRDTAAARARMDSMRAGQPMPMRRDTMAMPMRRDTMPMPMRRDTMAMPMRRDSMAMGRQPMAQRPGMAPRPRMAMPMMTGDFDRMFLEHMVQHHQDGADMSVLTEDSQANARVKALARTIRGRQEQDIAEMRRLLAALPAPPAGHDH